MKTTEIFILSSTNVPLSIDGVGFSAVPGASFVVPNDVAVTTPATGFAGGDAQFAYISTDGSVRLAGEPFDSFQTFSDGFGFGCVFAGAIFAFWMVRVMNRSVAES